MEMDDKELIHDAVHVDGKMTVGQYWQF